MVRIIFVSHYFGLLGRYASCHWHTSGGPHKPAGGV